MPEQEAPDYPLSVSHEALRAIAAWGSDLRPCLVDIVADRSRPAYEHAAAAFLLRLPTLCDGLRCLGEAHLFDESATLARVVFEFAITARWVGKDNERAMDLGRDAAYHSARGDGQRELWLGIPATSDNPPDEKKLPNLWARAEQAGDDDLKRLYASFYQWGSDPTHNPTSVLAHLDDETAQQYGCGVAALAVLAMAHLGGYAATNLEITDQPVRSAVQSWRAARAIATARPSPGNG